MAQSLGPPRVCGSKNKTNINTIMKAIQQDFLYKSFNVTVERGYLNKCCCRPTISPNGSCIRPGVSLRKTNTPHSFLWSPWSVILDRPVWINISKPIGIGGPTSKETPETTTIIYALYSSTPFDDRQTGIQGREKETENHFQIYNRGKTFAGKRMYRRPHSMLVFNSMNEMFSP